MKRPLLSTDKHQTDKFGILLQSGKFFERFLFKNVYSGPARYNFDKQDKKWKNKDNEPLEEVLDRDIQVLRKQ